ncbi:DMT family transporter [Desulfogranum mediterraneum]|uniref:DMT family transporter n=1 Tax=Desulfogranum mediterraneum TaxID=160661 RepID=UPI0003F99ABF|nr:DMT family transporter [Desulfogranum mediterraneum]
MPYLLLILTTLFWSGNFVLSRGLHASIPPMGLSFWRWAVALLILSPFAVQHLWRQRELAREHLGFITLQGLLGVTGFNSLIYLAMQSTTAINAVLVNSSMPILIVIISWLMYRERLTLRQILGVGLSLCGVLLIIARGRLVTLFQVDFNQGDLYVLAAALLWALYSVNLKRYPQGLHPLAYLSAMVMVGLVGILPLYLAELAGGRSMVLNQTSVITVGYVALFASVLAFIFWNRAVRAIGANKAGPFVHLMPVFSTILAVLFLDETLTSYHLQGMVLIFSGIVMTTFRTRRP